MRKRTLEETVKNVIREDSGTYTGFVLPVDGDEKYGWESVGEFSTTDQAEKKAKEIFNQGDYESWSVFDDKLGKEVRYGN